MFCMKVIIKERWHLRLPLLVGCGQFFLSSNQIAGFFDHQYLWNESCDILVFFCLELVIKGMQHLRLPLLVGLASFPSHLITLQDSFIVNISERNPGIS